MLGVDRSLVLDFSSLELEVLCGVALADAPSAPDTADGGIGGSPSFGKSIHCRSESIPPRNTLYFLLAIRTITVFIMRSGSMRFLEALMMILVKELCLSLEWLKQGFCFEYLSFAVGTYVMSELLSLSKDLAFQETSGNDSCVQSLPYVLWTFEFC